jgi:hypothetical protein
VQMDQERRQQAQAGAQHCFCEDSQEGWWRCIIDLSVEREKRSTVEEKQRQAEKEEDALKIALTAIAEDYHHPEELQQCSGGVTDEPNVDQ